MKKYYPILHKRKLGTVEGAEAKIQIQSGLTPQQTNTPDYYTKPPCVWTHVSEYQLLWLETHSRKTPATDRL